MTRSRPPSVPPAPPRRVLPGLRVRARVVARVAVRVVLLGALAAGAARGDAPATPEPPQPPPTPPPAGAERVEVHLRYEPWVLTGRFRVVSASGTFADEGVARDDASFSAQRPIERVLEGARGTLVLRVAAGPKTPGFPPMFGRWTVVRGTGAYAALAGAGTFTTCGGGDAQKGSPFEVQTLVGYLHPRSVGHRARDGDVVDASPPWRDAERRSPVVPGP